MYEWNKVTICIQSIEIVVRMLLFSLSINVPEIFQFLNELFWHNFLMRSIKTQCEGGTGWTCYWKCDKKKGELLSAHTENKWCSSQFSKRAQHVCHWISLAKWNVGNVICVGYVGNCIQPQIKSNSYYIMQTLWWSWNTRIKITSVLYEHFMRCGHTKCNWTQQKSHALCE